MSLRSFFRIKSIAGRIWAMASLLALLGLALVAASVRYSAVTTDAAERIYTRGSVALLTASKLEAALARHRHIVANLTADGDQRARAVDRTALSESTRDFTDHRVLSAVANGIGVAPSGLTSLVADLNEAARRTLHLAEDSDRRSAADAASQHGALASRLQDAIGLYRARSAQRVEDEFKALSARADALRFWLASMFLLVCLVVAPLLYCDLRRMRFRITAMRGVMHDLASGRTDVAVPFETDSDEIGAFARAVAALKSKESSADTRCLDSANETLTQQILERSKTERELRETNRMLVSVTQAKSDFLARMSHEIRTPMNGILGMCELLQATPLSPRQSHLASTMQKSANLLLVIINDVLDLSRIEAGKVAIDDAPFELDQCVDCVVTTLHREARAKGIGLHAVIDPELPRNVCGDEARVRQILFNLIGNAIKFTDVGEVVIRLGRDQDPSGENAVRFEIRDTGIGIEKGALYKIFSPFTQADSSITRKYGGSGLGLAVVKRLVDLMNGSIQISSEPGHGTSACFVLPLPDAVSRSGAAVVPSGHQTERTVFLAVAATTRRLAAVSQLVRAGARVKAFATQEALRCAAADWTRGGNRIDLVVVERSGGLSGATVPSPTKLHGAPVVDFSDDDPSILAALEAAGAFAFRDTGSARRRPGLSTRAAALSHRDGPHGCSPAHDDGHGNGVGRIKVLVAEDNSVNQEIAATYLEIMGCATTLVENGREAVDAWEAGDFDLILMDCHMPLMDGGAAASMIRAREIETGRSRIPIGAVTADAFAASIDRFLQSGMDAYLIKPYSLSQLQALVRSLCPALNDVGPGEPALLDSLQSTGRRLSAVAPADARPACAETADEARPAIVDHSVLSAMSDARADLAQRLVQLFLAQLPAAIERLSSAAESSDFAALRSAAHNLKSSSANVGAARVAALCAELEQAAGDSSTQRCRALARTVAQTLDETASVLAQRDEPWEAQASTG